MLEKLVEILFFIYFIVGEMVELKLCPGCI